MGHAQKPSVDSEMHELNAEADFLEQKITVAPVGASGEDARVQPQQSDPDAQAMVIESLRSQVQDLFSQVSQLNNKLVRSYDRVSDLEDELHVTSQNLRQATIKVGQLELERTQHLSALSTGLLVEKSHVTSELTRLMEKATEEAARRGQAESARAEIEKELDDLSAGLFDQANRMVAEARIAEAKSARKVEETEAALRSAEEIVGALQAQMQTLEADKEQADRRVEEMRLRMGKGKWVEHGVNHTHTVRRHLFASHVPYHEFLVFVSHLRAIRPASPHPPAMSTLTPLPFLARIIAEDSDPTVRLDLAPSLNWLSRRSVIGAIHSGQLTIEPIQFTTLLEELAPPNIPTSHHHTHVVCALCGMLIYSSASDSSPSTPTTPYPLRSGSQSASWSTTLFKNVRSGEITLPALTGQNHRHTPSFGSAPTEPPTQVYIFRLDSTSSGLPMSLPLSTQQPGTPTRQAIYPLCTSGWCLARLRTTCSLWAFVRTSIVEKVWEEPPMPTPTHGIPKPGVNGFEKKPSSEGENVNDRNSSSTRDSSPRRPKVGSALGSLWGSMQRSLSGTPAVSKSQSTENVSTKISEPPKERPKLPPRDPSRKTLPPPPPTHPAVSHSPRNSTSQSSTNATVHRVPPPFKEEKESLPPVVAAAAASPPPPLPKRNRGRERTITPELNGDVKASTDTAHPEASSTEQPKEPSAPAPQEETAPALKEPEAVVGAPAKQEAPHAEGEAKAAAADEGAAPKSGLIVATGPISQSTSTESFSTPTEELQVDIAAKAPSSEPSSEPSPQKTPTTEQAPAVESAPEIVSAEPPAIEAAASTPTTATPVAEAKSQPPSRTGSPAPPPLPRRAAARARPLSALVPQNEEQSKRDSIDVPSQTEAIPEPAPVTEEPTSTEQKAEEAKETVPEQTQDEAKENSDAEASAPAPEASSDAPAPVEPIAVVDATSHITEEPQSIAATENPPATPPTEDSAPASESDAVAAPADVLKTDLATAPAEKTSLVNGHAESAHSESESVSEAPPAYAPGEVQANGDSKEKLVANVAEEPDNGQYIGDATWEERTYKELVRLREEMFWARIGAIVH
ncbi:hypothetical protein BD311DRAFT_726948 [Dichomitus squalens]|uniref:GDP/GTP exchange factor Sec2 N-terminal domain-containing protein n=1 Tax=Dichomitus squalens TaxID=114155 RepID=A0A4Q9MEZ1_9APHY|nr:hypothetical protein BD311DRAFT_726948 [Dichomitus squalens]